MKSNLKRERLLLGMLYISMVIAIFVAVLFAVSHSKITEPKVFLGGEEIAVTIADTPALQERGLSGHKPLARNEGMLFIFPETKSYGFWMKDMLFPIDIIWFDANRKIVDVWEHAAPDSYPKIYTPREGSLYVLEVSAGFFANHALKRGDVLELGTASGYNK